MIWVNNNYLFRPKRVDLTHDRKHLKEVFISPRAACCPRVIKSDFKCLRACVKSTRFGWNTIFYLHASLKKPKYYLNFPPLKTEKKVLLWITMHLAGIYVKRAALAGSQNRQASWQFTWLWGEEGGALDACAYQHSLSLLRAHSFLQLPCCMSVLSGSGTCSELWPSWYARTRLEPLLLPPTAR